MNPKISIILPYYEGQQWLANAIRSVQKQSRQDWELIIVDDGSKNTGESIIGRFDDKRIKYIWKEHAGKGAAINKGVALANAEIICFLDQDDIMLPDRLALQINAFEEFSNADVVYSDYERAFENGVIIDKFISRQATKDEHLLQMAKSTSFISMQTIIIKREAFFAVGAFSENMELTGLDDLEFFLRLCISDLNLKYYPGIVQRWIKHKNNFSQSRQFQTARLQLLKNLSELAKRNIQLRNIEKFFRFHAYYMRGLYFLENKDKGNPLPEFIKSLIAKPNSWNSYYLLIKSVIFNLQH